MLRKQKFSSVFLGGMIRGKSQGSLPKAEGVIIFYTPRNKPALGLVVHGVTRHQSLEDVLGTMHGAAKPWGAAMGLSWVSSTDVKGTDVSSTDVSSTDVKGLCLWGVQEPWGHPWASGLECQGSAASRDCQQAPAHSTLRAALFPSQPSRFVSGRSLPTDQE